MVADLLEHAADLAVAAFGEGDLVPGVLLIDGKLDGGGLGEDGEGAALGAGLLFAAHAGEARLGRQHDSVAQFVDLFFGGLAADLDHVGFGNVRAGLGQLRHELAIVGEQQEAFAHVIETADGENTLVDALEQIHDGGATFRIADGGHVALGFVESDVDVALGAAQQLAIHANLVNPGIGLGAGLGDDFTVHTDNACGDQFFGFTTRGESCRR